MPNVMIHVLPADDPNQGRAGTFVGPPPLLKLKKNVDTVTFRITPANYTFAVLFPGFSPLNNTDPITDSNPGPFSVGSVGNYHYQVRVIDTAGKVYTISNCPEMDVGD